MMKLSDYKEDNINSPATLRIGAQHACREKDPSIPCSCNSNYNVLISYTALLPSAKCVVVVCDAGSNTRLRSGL